jgi:hypothetical protein
VKGKRYHVPRAEFADDFDIATVKPFDETTRHTVRHEPSPQREKATDRYYSKSTDLASLGCQTASIRAAVRV